MSRSDFCLFKLSFDIGYSSIGWSVFKIAHGDAFPILCGCGSLVFDDDCCMAKSRAAFRRARKNIASRRNRIKRMRKVLLSMGVMGPEELDNAKTDYPWLLASRVLSCGNKLSWGELWSVLRYYAHNRGYDGNSAWAKFDGDDGDSEKEANAIKLMQELGTRSQAETVCAYLGVDPSSSAKPALRKYFKGQNVAFPRQIVISEVGRIIDAHIGHLPGCDENFKKLIMGNWREVPSPIEMPGRFTSDRGLLFGQYVPRFNNRIIPKCPIEGRNVPSCHSREFLNFRWKSLLSNMSFSEGIDIAAARKNIDSAMRLYGSFKKTTLKTIFKSLLGELPLNYESMFLSEEMDKALLLDPVRALILKTIYPNISHSLPSAELVQNLWDLIPKFIFTQMFRLKEYSLEDICGLLEDKKRARFRSLLLEIFDSSPNSKKTPRGDFENVFKLKMRINKISGRAPYSRIAMKKACAEIMEGRDPRANGGALYRNAENARSELLSNIDTWSNNHLVRHRLKMFKRLYVEIVNRYCGGDLSAVKSVAVEVVKDMGEFSGLDPKERAAKLNDLVCHHKSVSEYLEETYPELKISGSIIRKARIADDLGWVCPYTGRHFSPRELFESGNMELDHIIPYSLRPSNSLESLVATWKAVNEMKGQRCAAEFIKECQGMEVPGMPNVSIVTPERFEKFVSGLKKPQHNARYPDLKRIKKRNKLLLTLKYNKREGEFLPADLTQTSHLNKLAFKVVDSLYVDSEEKPELVHLPGSVTSVLRTNWDLSACMAKACPEIIVTVKSADSASGERSMGGDGLPQGLNGSVTDTAACCGGEADAPQSGGSSGGEKKVLLMKGKIRSITHLHHAVDAVAIGLAAAVFPHTNRFYELVSKRNLNRSEREELYRTGLFVFSERNWRLKELPAKLINEISDRIAEGRVVKYLPRKMSGMDVEQTLWGVVKEDVGGLVTIRQYHSKANSAKRRERKIEIEKKIKLLGYEPENVAESKLARNKAVIIIKGNFGVALTTPPKIIPRHKVWQRLGKLAAENGGKFPIVLRKNQIIDVACGRYAGRWRITSIKNNAGYIGIDMIPPIYASGAKNRLKVNVNLNTLVRDGMSIKSGCLTGAC